MTRQYHCRFKTFGELGNKLSVSDIGVEKGFCGICQYYNILQFLFTKIELTNFIVSTKLSITDTALYIYMFHSQYK